MSQRRDIVHEKPELELKVASRALVRAAGGTDGAAETVGSRQQRMSDVGHKNTPDFLRIDEVGRLEDVTADPHVTRALAARQGFILVAKPGAAPDAADWHGALASTVQEFGDVTKKILEALPGGVSGAEIAAARIREEIAEAMTCLAQLDALAARAMEGE